MDDHERDEEHISNETNSVSIMNKDFTSDNITNHIEPSRKKNLDYKSYHPL